jgi:hypothetical protein
VILGAIALIVVGSLVVSVIGALFKLALYLIVGAVVVGGGLYVYRRARRSITGTQRRQLP